MEYVDAKDETITQLKAENSQPEALVERQRKSLEALNASFNAKSDECEEAKNCSIQSHCDNQRLQGELTRAQTKINALTEDLSEAYLHLSDAYRTMHCNL